MLQDRWRTWKPIPQVVLQGDHKVQRVQPPFLGRGSIGVTESDWLRVHPVCTPIQRPSCVPRVDCWDCELGREREPEP